ncbi:hypothetical protein DSCO28_10810 [Desulfosarcina ovata subsp. sediminis]|uniref:Uncharacterized protein n=1 Tax=Desulfosarcina ovata subsp. sediminis TaxID=885957 RepID=A0A5K7ZJV2_9BACT|nr:hypothetical protein [Desulfosarcina ovata]BBO80515.1 hypothetical protein DSCO28_10810 [Desulfosarcina ovata subsp. sediminis]
MKSNAPPDGLPLRIAAWRRPPKNDRHHFCPALANENGSAVNPVAAALFCGLVLIIVVYTTLDRTGLMVRLGRFGPVLPLLIIAWLMYGIYRGFRLLKQRSARIRIKGPLYLRALMNDCLERTCGPLEKRLNSPEISSAAIFNDILLDKMQDICRTDCLRFSDIRRRIEGSRLKGTANHVLAPFFQTATEYLKRPLPEEIRQVDDMASRSRKDFKPLLQRLKATHQALCTGTGDILSLLPPDPKKVEKIRSSYRYRPPTPERAARMAFALETLVYLKAIRHENVNPMDRRRYDAVAGKVIPQLADALSAYRQAWQVLVDAYEQPQGQ